MNLLRPCVSVTVRMCRLAWPHSTPKAATEDGQVAVAVMQHWSRLLCGVAGRGQVLGGRCWQPPDEHLHSSSILAAAGTPGPKNSRGKQTTTHHQDDPDSPSAWEDDEHPEAQEEVDISDIMVAALQDVFGMSEKDAVYTIVSCLPPRAAQQDVLHNLHRLKECGIAVAQIHRIPWILTEDPDELKKKLIKIKEPYLFREHREGLGFCYLPLESMSMYQERFRRESSKFRHHPSRIYYLAERIQVPVELFAEKLGKPHRILTMSIQRLDSMIDLFHWYGVSPEDIVADLWVFEYSAKRAEKRLHRAAEMGCTKLKMWMCRCSDEIFDRFCSRYQCEKELLGEHESVLEFLAKRLECDRSVLEKGFWSNLIMEKVHIIKFNRILDLLFSEGITSEEIRSCMQVFQYAEVRIAARIKELKRIGFFPFPLILLCRTPAQFKKVVSMYKKRKCKIRTSRGIN